MSYQTKHNALANLDRWTTSLQKSRRALGVGSRVPRKEARNVIKDVAIEWFDGRQNLLGLGMAADDLRAHDAGFEQLVKLSQTKSRAKIYRDAINTVIPLLEKLMLEIIKIPVPEKHMHELDAILAGVDTDEIPGLADAVAYAQARHYKGSVILG